MTVTWEFLVALGTIAGAAGAITYWGGRIARSVEQVVEGLQALRTDLNNHTTTLAEHGERITAVETRQEVRR